MTQNRSHTQCSILCKAKRLFLLKTICFLVWVKKIIDVITNWMKNLSSQGQHYEGVTCYWLFLEIFLSGICVGPWYGQQTALMTALAGLRDLELFVNISMKKRRKKWKDWEKWRKGIEGKGERLGFIRAVLSRDLLKSSVSSLARVKTCWIHSHCASKIP